MEEYIALWIAKPAPNCQRLLQPSDYYLFLHFHMGTNDVAMKSLRSIKTDFKALGRMLKNLGVHSVFLNPPGSGGKLWKK